MTEYIVVFGEETRSFKDVNEALDFAVHTDEPETVVYLKTGTSVGMIWKKE